MDDEFEDRVLYQTYVSHMKLLSKFAVGIPPLNSTLAYLWKLFRFYMLKPEVLICGVIVFIFLVYLQAVEVWSRGFLGRIQSSLGYTRTFRTSKLNILSSSQAEKQSWEQKKDVSAVYAVQGRRPQMEDRFVIDENINDNTGISIFAIFDGHGGEFAADYAKDILIQNLYNKIIETSNIIHGKIPISNTNDCYTKTEVESIDLNKENKENKKENDNLIQRKNSIRKSYSKTEENLNKTNNNNIIDSDILNRLNTIVRPISKDNFFTSSNHNSNNNNNNKPIVQEGKCYIDNGKINYGKLLTDEVLAADYKLVEQAKKNTNVAGTTALIAILEGSKLVVANVGDSRGVMCDSKGTAIPLSFDHKPQQVREHKRIHEAGGFIAFKGVWRVAGILATSRALGDYPLKDKNLVIADPDILTFDLIDHKPMFIILASDGLWDTFSNEEAVAYIKERLDEPHFGAKSITLQSYHRGSVDNITVLVIKFVNGRYYIGRS